MTLLPDCTLVTVLDAHLAEIVVVLLERTAMKGDFECMVSNDAGLEQTCRLW